MALNKNLISKPLTVTAASRRALDHFVKQVIILTENQPDDEYDERDIVFNLIQSDNDDGLRAYGLGSMVWYRNRELDCSLLFRAITDLYTHDTLLELCHEGGWITNDDDDDDTFHVFPTHNPNRDAILIEGIYQYMRDTIL